MKPDEVIGRQDPYAADCLGDLLLVLAADARALKPHSQTPMEFRAGVNAVEIALADLRRKFLEITG